MTENLQKQADTPSTNGANGGTFSGTNGKIRGKTAKRRGRCSAFMGREGGFARGEVVECQRIGYPCVA